jgi:outer membrane protein assembly factor BamB
MTAQPRSRRLLAAALTLAVLGAVVVGLQSSGDKPAPTPNPAYAQGNSTDWTMYGGTLSRNMVNTTVSGVPDKWDVKKKTNILWSADLGSKSYGGPIVAGGRIFVGTNNQKPRNPKDVDDKGAPIDLGVLMCFDEKSGEFKWQATFKKLEAGRVVDWPYEGLCSTPCVEGEKIYYVSNRCEVVCANVKDGVEVWKLDMIKNLGVFPHNLSVCSPIITGDDVWIVTANGVDENHINVPAPKAPSFIRINKNNGQVTWTDNSPTVQLTEVKQVGKGLGFFKSLVNAGKLIQHGQWSNPAYAVVNNKPQVVFPGGDGWIYSFDASSGKLIWKFDCNPKDSAYELAGKGTRNDFIATPVIYKNRVYIGVGQDPEHETGVGHLWCIDMTKEGDVSPELVTDDSVWPPKTKPNPNSAMVWHYGGAIPEKERGKLGRNYYFGRTMSTCAIKDDIVYAAELSGWLHVLDANTGKVHYSYDTGNMTWSSPYWLDGKVYLGNDDGIVTVFKHGKTEEVLEQIEMPGRVRATPVAANGVLYVMTENRLFAIAKK